jgi:inorganic pyrophosphatase
VDELLPGSDPSSPLLGDGDPVDALDISSDLSLVHGESLNGTTGAVYAARVVGALAMIDGGEVDWKLMLVRPTDPVMGDVVGAGMLSISLSGAP